jgi:Putative addiction module component.
MSIEEIESAALQLAASDRARLAERLLESLEQLSNEENEKLWAEEAIRRDKEWDLDSTAGRPARDVLSDARAKLK